MQKKYTRLYLYLHLYETFNKQRQSTEYELWKIMSDLGALYSLLQQMPLKTQSVYQSQPRFHTSHSAALNKV